MELYIGIVSATPIELYGAALEFLTIRGWVCLQFFYTFVNAVMTFRQLFKFVNRIALCVS